MSTTAQRDPSQPDRPGRLARHQRAAAITVSWVVAVLVGLAAQSFWTGVVAGAVAGLLMAGALVLASRAG